tara:strand:- start:6149 stop:7246 length:1098 start_codon:yes stop_codon:yes gene_type:complete
MEINRKKFTYKEGFAFEDGQNLPSIDLMVDTYGSLNKDRSNAILVCHAFSGSHHAAGIMEGDTKAGWWDDFIGDNKTFDTSKYFIVSINNLGSCFGSSGPTSINSETDKPYGSNFPNVTVQDWVNSQKLVMEELKIPSWALVAGGSLGGMQALQWAVTYPNRIEKAAIIAATSETSPQNIALNEVAREMIKRDESFFGGDYYSEDVIPRKGLKTARMLGHITYLSESNISARFGRKKQSPTSKVDDDVNYEIENYLRYKGDRFAEMFDANSYLLMTKAMDEFNLAAQYKGGVLEALKNITARLLIISFDSDWLFPTKHSKHLQEQAMKAGIRSSFIELEGNYGHDSFLYSSEYYDKSLKNFLEVV